MKSPPRIPLPNLTNIRRRILPLAATAAAMGLTGCGILGGGHHADSDARSTSLTPESSAEQVRAFTAGLDDALAKIERDKYKAAAAEEQKTAPDETSAVSPISIAKTPPTLPELPSILFPPEYSALPDQPDAPGAGPILTMASFMESDPLLKRTASVPKLESPEAPRSTPPSIDAALETLHDRIAAHPTLATALALALLENAEGKTPDPAVLPVAQTLSPNDQKLLRDLLGALQGMTATTAAPTLSERAAPLLEAAKNWQNDADLNLPKLILASRVDSYGVYIKLDPKFPAGKKQTVIIYCEVANFSPKKTDDGWYETRLSQQETLATDDGLLLWRPNAEDVEDRSKNQRHDFYLVKKLTIPDNLAVGKYALRMSVTDKNTNKIAVITLPIEITN